MNYRKPVKVVSQKPISSRRKKVWSYNKDWTDAKYFITIFWCLIWQIFTACFVTTTKIIWIFILVIVIQKNTKKNPAKSLENSEKCQIHHFTGLFQNSRLLTEAIHQLISHSSQDWSRRWNGPNLIVYHMIVVGDVYLNINSPSDSEFKKENAGDGRLVKNCLRISYSICSCVEITCFLSSKSRLKNMLLWRKTRQATIMMDGQGKIIHLISEKKVAKLS